MQNQTGQASLMGKSKRGNFVGVRSEWHWYFDVSPSFVVLFVFCKRKGASHRFDRMSNELAGLSHSLKRSNGIVFEVVASLMRS